MIAGCQAPINYCIRRLKYNAHIIMIFKSCFLSCWFFNWSIPIRQSARVWIAEAGQHATQHLCQKGKWAQLTGPTNPATMVMSREKMATSIRVWQNLQNTRDRDAPSVPRRLSSSCHSHSSLNDALPNTQCFKPQDKSLDCSCNVKNWLRFYWNIWLKG